MFCKKYFFKFVIFAIFAIATVLETELGYLRNCEPPSKTKLGYLRNCDFFAIAIRNFAIIAIFAIDFTTLLKTTLLSLQAQSKRLKNWPIVNRSVLPLTKKLVDFWPTVSHSSFLLSWPSSINKFSEIQLKISA